MEGRGQVGTHVTSSFLKEHIGEQIKSDFYIYTLERIS